MKKDTDEEIAMRVQKGERETFALLVERYQRNIARYARKFLSVREDIDDLTQEVFVKAYVNIQSFDATRRFSSWLYRIAHNEFVNALQKKSHQPFFPFDFDELFPHPIAPETADRDSELRELSAALQSCLDKLPLKYRESLVLYFFEELRYVEIADVLHIPVGTVGVRIARGKKKLKDLCEKSNGFVSHGL